MSIYRPKSRTSSEESEGSSTHFRISQDAEKTLTSLSKQNEAMTILMKLSVASDVAFGEKLLNCSQNTRSKIEVYFDELINSITCVRKEILDNVAKTSFDVLKENNTTIIEKKKLITDLEAAQEELDKIGLALKQKPKLPETLQRDLQSNQAKLVARQQTFKTESQHHVYLDVHFQPPAIKDVENLLRKTSLKLNYDTLFDNDATRQSSACAGDVHARCHFPCSGVDHGDPGADEVIEDEKKKRRHADKCVVMWRELQPNVSSCDVSCNQMCQHVTWAATKCVVMWRELQRNVSSCDVSCNQIFRHVTWAATKCVVMWRERQKVVSECDESIAGECFVM